MSEQMNNELFAPLTQTESDAIKGGAGAADPWLASYLPGYSQPTTTVSTSGGFNFSTTINVSGSFNQDNDSISNSAFNNGNFVPGNGNPFVVGL